MGEKTNLNYQHIGNNTDEIKDTEEDSLLPTVYIIDGKTIPELPEKINEDEAPKDKLFIVYAIFLIHGIGTLMPWNMFINANDYFVNYKLGGNSTSSEENVYSNYFLSFLGFTSQTPNVVLNFVNVFLQCGSGGKLAARITCSILVVTSMFIMTVVLAMVDSSTWPAAFFWITMVTVVIINMGNGVYQNCVFGSAAFLPMKYTNAVVVGSNTSGTLIAVLNIVAIALAPDPRTAAIYYFMAAIIILLLAFNSYFYLQNKKFYRYHRAKVEGVHNDQEKKDEKKEKKDEKKDTGTPPFAYIFRKCWKQHLGVWFVFFVTLTCFPAIQAKIKPADPNFFVTEKYFTPVFTFLCFNLFALIGNIVSNFEFMHIPGPNWVWIPIVLRALFIPFFVFCNFEPEKRDLPVFFNNDYIYILGVILMAFTSGWHSSLTMMYAPGCVEGKYQGVAGMMAAFFLIFGIMCGIMFSIPVTYLVTELSSDNPLMVGANSTNITIANVTTILLDQVTTIGFT